MCPYGGISQSLRAQVIPSIQRYHMVPREIILRPEYDVKLLMHIDLSKSINCLKGKWIALNE